MGWLGDTYLWVQAAHVIFVIFWMAGLLILPRYMMLHRQAFGTPEAAQWTERTEKLRRVILMPSIGLVWLLGLALAVNLGLLETAAGLGWLHAKLLLVFLLSGYQGWMLKQAKKLAAGTATLELRQLKLLGEVPALAVVLIVILVIVRPF